MLEPGTFDNGEMLGVSGGPQLGVTRREGSRSSSRGSHPAPSSLTRQAETAGSWRGRRRPGLSADWMATPLLKLHTLLSLNVPVAMVEAGELNRFCQKLLGFGRLGRVFAEDGDAVRGVKQCHFGLSRRWRSPTPAGTSAARAFENQSSWPVKVSSPCPARALLKLLPLPLRC